MWLVWTSSCGPQDRQSHPAVAESAAGRSHRCRGRGGWHLQRRAASARIPERAFGVYPSPGAVGDRVHGADLVGQLTLAIAVDAGGAQVHQPLGRQVAGLAAGFAAAPGFVAPGRLEQPRAPVAGQRIESAAAGTARILGRRRAVHHPVGKVLQAPLRRARRSAVPRPRRGCGRASRANARRRRPARARPRGRRSAGRCRRSRGSAGADGGTAGGVRDNGGNPPRSGGTSAAFAADRQA